MLFWLEEMQFDNLNRFFSKLNLNESDAKVLIKGMSLLRIPYNTFVYSFIVFLIFSANYAAFKRNKEYYFYYFISLLLYAPQLYINSFCIFGFLFILYQVSQYLINFMQLIFDYRFVFISN